MPCAMKRLCASLFFLLAPAAFAAAGPAPLGANNGKFGDWTAATYGSGANKVCYAFTAARHSKPVLRKRGAVVLTVTERAGVHDEVTLSAGYTYPKDAKVSLKIGAAAIDFYTQGGTAFTTGGAQAVAALQRSNAAQAVSTGPHGHDVTDDFSLAGFSDAYGAITGACP